MLRNIVFETFDTNPLRSWVTKLGQTAAGRRLLTSLYRIGVYESCEEAWRAAGKSRHAGHEHPEAVAAHSAVANSLFPSDYAFLYWLNKIPGDIRLFDYGGNMGNLYYSCAPRIDIAQRSLRWTVYDLPGVIDIARGLAAQRSDAAPEFTTSLQDAKSANVLLICGAYHYWEKSTEAFLDQFPHLPEHVFINRSPFYSDKSQPVVSIQATLTFAFPIVIRSRHEVIQGFESRGYELVDLWQAAEYAHMIPFFPEKSIRSYTGLYFRLKKA